MASTSRLARFVTEVAPPQVVSVMRRHRASKRLETISEEDRDINSINNSLSSSLSLNISAAAASSSVAAAPATHKINYFLKAAHRCYSSFDQ